MQELTIHEAIKFAVDAHEGQEYGKFEPMRTTPYVFHPLRVMMRTPRRSWIPAVCHDLLEDCGVLPPNISADDREVVELLTRDKDNETYDEYIDRLKNATGHNAIRAREVKRADLHENLEHEPPARLAQRYRKALSILGGF